MWQDILPWLKDILAWMGAFFLALIVFVVLVFLWARWKIRRIVKSLRDMAPPEHEPPPFRIELVSAAPVAWEDPDRVEELALPLKRRGFFKIGEYRVEPTSVFIAAWRHSKDQVYAVVYAHPQAGVWADVATRYEDGTSYTISNARDDLLEHPPQKTMRYLEEKSTEVLCQQMLATRIDDDIVPATADGFASMFESEWANEMDWRIARGGPTRKELRRIAERDGFETNPDTVTAARQAWRSAINEFYAEQLREEYLKSAKITAGQWEEIRDRIVFVHDQLTEEDLVELYCLGLDVDEDDEDDKSAEEYERAHETAHKLAGEHAPRIAFEKLNARLPTDQKFVKLGKLDTPIKADVYQAHDDVV